MHTDRANLIMWYLSIWRSDLKTGHTVVTIRILRSFLWCVMNELMNVMQSWFFRVHGWSFRSSFLIKSWVQNWVSIDIQKSTYLRHLQNPIVEPYQALTTNTTYTSSTTLISHNRGCEFQPKYRHCLPITNV